MDDDVDRWLFDPPTTRELVLAHRPAGGVPVCCVVSDVVWSEVVGLLRWARASPRGAPELVAGARWRLAVACADLLRRLPGLCDEICEPWGYDGPVPEVTSLPPGDRIDVIAGSLTDLLRTRGHLPLRRLAAAVDALGDAAVRALADQALATREESR